MLISAAMEISAFLLWITGIPWLVREVFCRKKVSVILYHDPAPEIFAKHAAHLAKHYNFVTTGRLIEAIRSGDFSSLPPKSLVVHFDDGHASNRALLDIFRRHGIVPTIFICSRITGTNRRFWFYSGVKRVEILRRVEHHHLRKILEEETGFTVDREYPDRQALDREEIAEMAGQVDFQSHGRYHFSLFSYDDGEVADDLRESRETAGEIAGRICVHYSYPYGDYSAKHAAAVRDCGYESARTTETGWITAGTDPFRLKIVADVPAGASGIMLRAHLSGIPRYIKRMVYNCLSRHVYQMKAGRL